MSSRVAAWERAALVPRAADGRRLPAVASLPVGLPTVEGLFEFMRDAELRFSTLKMRLEVVRTTAIGSGIELVDVAIRHPGRARVTTSWPDRGPARNYELWVSDGTTVTTFSGVHHFGTVRPVRRRLVGLDDPDLPGRSRIYEPLTPLPPESAADTAIHPAGYCQNVLATGSCRIVGSREIAAREGLLLECRHPRTIELAADRADYRLEVTVDREIGVISRLSEWHGEQVSFDARAVSLEPDAPIQDSAFVVEFPSDARTIF